VGTSGSAKMSGSAGGAPTPADALEIFEPPLVRWLYARRRPEQSITLAFDAEVGRVYDEWDALSRRVADGKADAAAEAVFARAAGPSDGLLPVTPRPPPFRTPAGLRAGVGGRVPRARRPDPGPGQPGRRNARRPARLRTRRAQAADRGHAGRLVALGPEHAAVRDPQAPAWPAHHRAADPRAQGPSAGLVHPAVPAAHRQGHRPAAADAAAGPGSGPGPFPAVSELGRTDLGYTAGRSTAVPCRRPARARACLARGRPSGSNRWTGSLASTSSASTSGAPTSWMDGRCTPRSAIASPAGVSGRAGASGACPRVPW